MEKQKEYTREELLKIVLEKLSYASSIKKEKKENADMKSYSGNNWLNKEEFNNAITDLIQIFRRAGYGHEIMDLEVKYEKLSYSTAEYSPIFSYMTADIGHALNLDEYFDHFSRLVYDFLKIISCQKEEEQYDGKIIIDFVPKYLAGFIYNASCYNGHILNLRGIEFIEALFNFYGLTLTEEEKGIIIENAWKETNNYYRRKNQDFNSEMFITPKSLSEYIIHEIFNRLEKKEKLIKNDHVIQDFIKKDDKKINLEEEKDDVENLDVNFSELSLDEKISLIKQKVSELEELSEKEKELTEALTKILSDKERVKEEINSFKL